MTLEVRDATKAGYDGPPHRRYFSPGPAREQSVGRGTCPGSAHSPDSRGSEHRPRPRRSWIFPPQAKWGARYDKKSPSGVQQDQKPSFDPVQRFPNSHCKKSSRFRSQFGKITPKIRSTTINQLPDNFPNAARRQFAVSCQGIDRTPAKARLLVSVVG